MSEKTEKRKAFMENIRSIQANELGVKAANYTEQLFWLEMKHRSKQLTETGNLRKVKKSLARVKTVMRQSRVEAARKGASK